MARQGTGTTPAHRPYVPAEIILPELTGKAIILGILLSVVLASANVYLGLFAGLTVSASIPAAVISMGILRLFRNRNILENNIVQTATSAGESLAAGIIFTIPALVILGAWDSFTAHAWETIVIAIFAGVLGVIFTVPLRRAFIVEAQLRFPEGIACAEVLEVGEEGGHGVRIIALGGLVGALVKFFSGGLALWKETAELAWRPGGVLVPFGTNLSPALVGVGYIVGANIATVVFLGGVIAWLIAMPIYTLLNGIPPTVVSGGQLFSTETMHGLVLFAGDLWSSQIRYMGVGAMAVGGLYALVRLARPLVDGMANGVRAYREARAGGPMPLRTEQDIPAGYLGILGLVAVIPLTVIFVLFTESVPHALMLAVVLLVVGFLFSSVAGYMAGLVGSSNNPVSGVTIAATLVGGALLFLTGLEGDIGTLGTIGLAATVASAAALAGDNMQDLKTGYLVGSTPRNQQMAQLLGVSAAALVIPFILEIIHQSYGICTGAATDPSDCLSAPQATLISSVAGAFFGNPIPWTMAAIGAGIALVVIALDIFLETAKSPFRLPVLAVAVGVYLPLELTTAIFIGGMAALAVQRYHKRRERLHGDRERRKALGLRSGLLLASGLIAGEAIMGILLGIPRLPAFSPDGSNPLALGGGLPGAFPISGLLVLAFVVLLLYYVGIRPFTRRDRV